MDLKSETLFKNQVKLKTFSKCAKLIKESVIPSSNTLIPYVGLEHIVLRPRFSIPPEYGYCFARTNEFRSHAIANMTGTSGRQRVPESCFDEYKAVRPPTETIQMFGNISKELFLKIKETGELRDNLIHLRDTLLPKLMSGDLIN